MSELENQEIKKRARRRLVGAIALVIVAAIVLPLTMDHEPHSSVQDIQVTIPDRNAAAGLARGPAAGEAITAPLDDVPATGQASADKAAPPPGVPVPGAPASAPVAADAPASSSAVPPSAASAEEEARVKLILGGQTPAPRSEAIVIQVGAFSDAGKAARLVAELRAKGFAAYTEGVGDVIRVRVGPLTSRSEADAAIARLKAAGHQAVIPPR